MWPNPREYGLINSTLKRLESPPNRRTFLHLTRMGRKSVWIEEQRCQGHACSLKAMAVQAFGRGHWQITRWNTEQLRVRA